MRARRDPTHVRGPRPRRKAPRRSRRELEQSLELTPAFAAVVAAEQPARLGARVHRTVGRAARNRKDTGFGQPPAGPPQAAIVAPPNTALSQPRVERVLVRGIARDALRRRPA